jgi:2,3-bisphosphoglycerate-independent phosphoglycerate mutase
MRPVVLLILDGWGVAPAGNGNAISLANLPFYTKIMNFYPNGLLEASGEAVGLPKGEDGNTETGHLNIGAGTIVYQDLPRINLSIADGSFFSNAAFIQAIDHARKYDSTLHLLGLIGSGGVHSNIEHLMALLQLLKEKMFNKISLHLITDGRDSPPKSATIYIEQLEEYLKNLGFGQIASVMGRYYAMDRDNRWNRTEKAYKALTQGIAQKALSAVEAVNNSYAKNITDEFIEPTLIIKNDLPISLISEKDSVIFFNYRIDRPRQLTKAFVLDEFEKDANNVEFDPYSTKYHKKHILQKPSLDPVFQRGSKIEHLYFVTMTEYSKDVHVSSVAFPPHIVTRPLGECIAFAGLKQLRMSESEKERFVTYYFNGQREAPFINEDRLIIQSPNVPTYDLKPEMSALELTDQLIKNIQSEKYDFIAVNFANPDMVAHTGVIDAAIKACECVDKCLENIIKEVLNKDGTVLITADHGNVEEMINLKTGGVDTEHSTFPVPFIAINKKWQGKNIKLPTGILADVAPTILKILNVEVPKTMTGRNLLEYVID